MAKVSVVIPTYNRAKYLKQALDSVLAQTHKDLEIIVVDDSSKDNTAEVVSSYGPQVRYIVQENRERGAARNRGIDESRGDYVAFLDSDDAWLPEHLERCLGALDSKKDEAAAYSGSYLMGEDGEIIEKLPASGFRGDPLKDIVSGFSSHGCNASSSVIKREIFEKAGRFSEVRELSGSEDWEMWARLASCSDLVFTGAYTAKIRFHPGKSSIDAGKMARSMRLAMDTVFSDKRLLAKISDLKGKAYSSLYTITAINYYAAGKMKEARHNLAMALRSYPASLIADPLLAYTFLRSLLGPGASSAIRNAKWGLGARLRR